ncbi:MAG: HEAT repeat domain-containing protein [Anaerolineales bacterium]|nr:HEAT repeat domain-containing protein [Anaerolineales bacterium]
MPFGPFGPFGMRFDLPEFAVGVLTGVVLLLVLRRLTPISDFVIGLVRDVVQRLREGFTAGAQDRYRSELIQRAETMHAAGSYLALREIVIPPRVLAPPPTSDPQSTNSYDAGALGVLPNLPDTTYLAAVYGAPSLLLTDAVLQGSDILLCGNLGTGKTTALAYLALEAAHGRLEQDSGDPYFPVLIHAADIDLESNGADQAFDTLISAVQSTASSGLSARVPGYLREHVDSDKLLLLLDGLDEHTEAEIKAYAEWIEELQAEHSDIQIVAAGPVRGYDGLVRSGLAPTTVAPWTDLDQREFLDRWGAGWKEHVAPHLDRSRLEDIDPTLITGWLAGTSRGMSPLELTLRAWAAHAGDVQGPGILDGYAAHLRRFLSTSEEQSAAAAASMWIDKPRGWIHESDLPRGTPVSSLVEAGILTRRRDRRLSFTLPALGAYLAGESMLEMGVPDTVDQMEWPPALTAHAFYVARSDASEEAEHYLQREESPLELNTLRVGRWLRLARPKANWRSAALRALGKIIQNRKNAYGLRLRCAHLMAEAQEPTASVFFRRLISSDQPSTRILGALGLGGVRDLESTSDLKEMINQDDDFRVRQACCLALSAIGSDEALEALGEALLNGEEEVRVAASEALANHPGEGQEMLREAVEVDDLLTRRAAVFGLARIRRQWATDKLQAMQVDDPQWVVRGAAAEALEKKVDPPYRVLSPPDEISEIPWLSEFASREGLGVAPGKPALEMLRRALNEGSADEQIAALEVLAWVDAGEFDLELRRTLTEGEPYLRDVAYEALWRQTAGTSSVGKSMADTAG